MKKESFAGPHQTNQIVLFFCLRFSWVIDCNFLETRIYNPLPTTTSAILIGILFFSNSAGAGEFVAMYRDLIGIASELCSRMQLANNVVEVECLFIYFFVHI